MLKYICVSINYKREVLNLKDTKSNRKRSDKRSRNKKQHTRSGDVSFVIQMIVFVIVTCHILFAGSVPQDFSESTPEITVVENVQISSLVEPTEMPTEQVAEPIAEPVTEPVYEPPLPLEIHQINVGQANAYLIRYDGFTIFVDGGKSHSYNHVKKYLENFGVKNIDVYIGTHWHRDHVGNMSNILLDYANDQTIVYGTTENPSSKYEVSKGTYIQMVHGTNFSVGNVSFLCVGPDEILHNGNENPDSINLLIQYNDFKFLMTADYIKDAAIEMYGEFLRNVDVLQMPHHGLQPFRISEMAMLYCNPEIMLVPVDNSYDSRHFLKTLGLETKVYDNKDGCIAIVSYGDGYRVYTDVETLVDLA